MGAVVFYIVLLVLLTPPLGAYMYRVYSRERIGAVEGVIYRLFGVNPNTEQSWRRYASSVLWLSAFSMVLLYILFRVQDSLPLNPQQLPGVDQYVSFNTACELHHQHELAGLRRRDHDELPQPDAGAHVPELRVRRRRDGRHGRPVPRVRPGEHRGCRELLA